MYDTGVVLLPVPVGGSDVSATLIFPLLARARLHGCPVIAHCAKAIFLLYIIPVDDFQ